MGNIQEFLKFLDQIFQKQTDFWRMANLRVNTELQITISDDYPLHGIIVYFLSDPGPSEFSKAENRAH